MIFLCHICWIIDFSVNLGEYGPKPGEIQKKTCKKSTLAFKAGSNSEVHHFLCLTEFHPVLTRLSFFLSASTVATYIFAAPTCTATIITHLVHEMLSFCISYPDLIKLPYFEDLTQRGDEKRPKDRVKTG
jgi:hypothetical protein